MTMRRSLNADPTTLGHPAQRLPAEVWDIALQHLKAADLLALRLTDKKFNTCATFARRNEPAPLQAILRAPAQTTSLHQRVAGVGAAEHNLRRGTGRYLQLQAPAQTSGAVFWSARCNQYFLALNDGQIVAVNGERSEALSESIVPADDSAASQGTQTTRRREILDVGYQPGRAPACSILTRERDGAVGVWQSSLGQSATFVGLELGGQRRCHVHTNMREPYFALSEFGDSAITVSPDGACLRFTRLQGRSAQTDYEMAIAEHAPDFVVCAVSGRTARPVEKNRVEFYNPKTGTTASLLPPIPGTFRLSTVHGFSPSGKTLAIRIVHGEEHTSTHLLRLVNSSAGTVSFDGTDGGRSTRNLRAPWTFTPNVGWSFTFEATLYRGRHSDQWQPNRQDIFETHFNEFGEPEMGFNIFEHASLLDRHAVYLGRNRQAETMWLLTSPNRPLAPRYEIVCRAQPTITDARYGYFRSRPSQDKHRALSQVHPTVAHQLLALNKDDLQGVWSADGAQLTVGRTSANGFADEALLIFDFSAPLPQHAQRPGLLSTMRHASRRVTALYDAAVGYIPDVLGSPHAHQAPPMPLEAIVDEALIHPTG